MAHDIIWNFPHVLSKVRDILKIYSVTEAYALTKK